jgi:hypothetical protein
VAIQEQLLAAVGDRNIDDISGLATTNMTVGAVARPPPSVR